MDERPCLWCLETIHPEDTLAGLFWQTPHLCRSCQEKLPLIQAWIRMAAKKVRLVYLKNQSFDDLWEQYSSQQDIALAQVFLDRAHQEVSFLKRYPCVSIQPLHRLSTTARDPLGDLLSQAGIVLHYPVWTRRGTPCFSWELERLLSLDSFQHPKRSDSHRMTEPAKGQKKKRLRFRRQKKKYKPYIAVCEQVPAREWFEVNPVLKEARYVWVLSSPSLKEVKKEIRSHQKKTSWT